VVIHVVTLRYRVGNFTIKTSWGVPLWHSRVRVGDVTCELYCILKVGVITLRMYSLHIAHYFYAMQLTTVTYYTGPEESNKLHITRYSEGSRLHLFVISSSLPGSQPWDVFLWCKVSLKTYFVVVIRPQRHSPYTITLCSHLKCCLQCCLGSKCSQSLGEYNAH